MSAIHADVIAVLDERSSRQVSQELEHHFGDAGRNASQAFTRAFSGFGTGVRQSLDEVVSGFSSQFGSLGGVAGKTFDGISTRAVGTAAAIAGVGVAAVAIGKQFYDLGSTWDDIADSITGRTGAMGADLEGIIGTVKEVGRTTALSLQQIGDFAGGVTQNLHLSGDAATRMTEQLASIQQVTKQVVDTHELGKAFRLFDVDDINAQMDALNHLRAVSQATGEPINELINSVRQAGRATKDFGLDFSQTAGIISAFDDAGLDVTKTASGLTLALKNLAKSGQEPAEGLAQTIDAIKRLHDTGQETAAINLATSTFGKGYVDFLNAIEGGDLDVKKLHDAINSLGSGDSLDKQKKATEDWHEQWVKITNYLSGTFEPIATGVFEHINNLLEYSFNPQALGDFVNKMWPGGAPAQNGVLPGAPNTSSPATVGGIPIPGLIVPNPVAPKLPPPPGPPPPPTLAGGGLGGPGLVNPNASPFVWGYKAPGSAGATKAPELPYPTGYGQPPGPGESPEQWQARMANIAAQHDLAEKQALVTKLEGDGNATADQVTKAHNDVIDAQMRAWQTEQSFRTAQLQQVKVPYAPGYGAAPRPGETAAQYSAESSFYEAQHKSAQARAELQQLEASGTATTTQLTEAHNNLIKTQNDEYQAQLRLSEAASKTSGKLDDIGAKLDPDLGISRGLAGIADNLVRFLGNLIAAPELTKLSAISQASPSQGGFGLFGTLGAQGAFGPQFTGLPQQGYGPSAIGPAGLQPTTGLPDAHGSHPQIAQIAAIAKSFGLEFTAGKNDHADDGGYHPAGMAGDFSNSTGNSAQELAFANYMAQNFGSSLQELIYSDPNFSQLIGGGKNVTGSGYYSPGVLGEHTNHVHVAMTDQAASGLANLPSPLPVSVQQWNAGGPSGSAGPASGTQQQAAGEIIRQAQAHGWNRDQTIAALSTGLQESGLSQSAPGGGGAWHGIFQQDTSYPGRDNMSSNIQAFFDRQGTPSGDPWSQIFALQQGTPYGPGARTGYMNEIQGHIPQATSLYDSLAGAPTSGGGWGGPGIPSTSTPGSGGQGPVWGASPQGPGVGAAAGTPLGGMAPKANPGGGGLGITPGGTLDTAISLAATGLDALAPGAGQAAQTGIKLANRAIQYGGQLAGIGVTGLMDTLLPSESPLGNIGNSWFGRIAGGFAGASPALPNMAGQQAPPKPMQGTDPNTTQHGTGQGQPPGPTNGVYIENFNGSQSDYSTANEIAAHQAAQYQPVPGRR